MILALGAVSRRVVGVAERRGQAEDRGMQWDIRH